MTKNTIVIEIYNDKAYIDYCKRCCNGNDIYKDLFQYVILTILGMEETKLFNIYKNNGLRNYIARIIYISANSKTSEFYRTINGKIDEIDIDYSHTLESLPNEIDEKLNMFDDEMEKECNACIQKGIYPASVMMYHLYEKHGSLSEVSRCTDIPFTTVKRHVDTIRDKIVKKINENSSSNTTKGNGANLS